MFLETMYGTYFYRCRKNILNMDRADLQEYLELRGFAVYDDESTELLRATALKDYDNEESSTLGYEAMQ